MLRASFLSLAVLWSSVCWADTESSTPTAEASPAADPQPNVASTSGEQAPTAEPSSLRIPLFIGAGAAGALSLLALMASVPTAGTALALKSEVEAGKGSRQSVEQNLLLAWTSVGLWVGSGAMAVSGGALLGAALLDE